MITGVSLSHSRGLGTYAGDGAGGQVASAVTGLYPWIGFKPSEKVTVLDGGWIRRRRAPARPRGRRADRHRGLSMAMIAGGGRGEIVANGDGFELAFKADALWVGTSTTAASGPGGNLVSTHAAVSRERTEIEGSQSLTFAGRVALTPASSSGSARTAATPRPAAAWTWGSDSCSRMRSPGSPSTSACAGC